MKQERFNDSLSDFKITVDLIKHEVTYQGP
jgi:hypothetical protein